MQDIWKNKELSLVMEKEELLAILITSKHPLWGVY